MALPVMDPSANISSQRRSHSSPASSGVSPQEAAASRRLTGLQLDLGEQHDTMFATAFGPTEAWVTPNSRTRHRSLTPPEMRVARRRRNEALREAASPRPPRSTRPSLGVPTSSSRLHAALGLRPAAQDAARAPIPSFSRGVQNARQGASDPHDILPRPEYERWLGYYKNVLVARGFTLQQMVMLATHVSAEARQALILYVELFLRAGYSASDVAYFASLAQAEHFLPTLAREAAIFHHLNFSAQDLGVFLWAPRAAERIMAFVQHPESLRTAARPVREAFLRDVMSYPFKQGPVGLDQFFATL